MKKPDLIITREEASEWEQRHKKPGLLNRYEKAGHILIIEPKEAAA